MGKKEGVLQPVCSRGTLSETHGVSASTRIVSTREMPSAS